MVCDISTSPLSNVALKIVANMDKEIWRPVKGYEGVYEVSNLGRVKGVERFCRGRHDGLKPVHEKILTTDVSNCGYLRVRLYLYGKSKRLYVHRIVAEAFIPNPDGLPQVNHKDENKKNNSVNNLEWCTASYNMNYGSCIERLLVNQPHRMEIYQYTIDGRFVAHYRSTNEAGRMTGIRPTEIRDCVKGRQGSAHGYKWYYEKQQENEREN